MAEHIPYAQAMREALAEFRAADVRPAQRRGGIVLRRDGTPLNPKVRNRPAGRPATPPAAQPGHGDAA